MKTPVLKVACALMTIFAAASPAAAAGEPQMGPFHNRMSFAQMRAAVPTKSWHARSFYDHGFVFTRVQFAYHGLDWLGRTFDLAYERTGYPSDAIFALQQFDAQDASKCEKEIAALADDLDAAIGTSPAEWNDSPPDLFGRSDSLLAGFIHFGEAKTAYGFVVPEATTASATVRTKARIKLSKFHLAGRGLGGADQRVTGWRAYRLIGNVMVRVLGSFDAAFPDATIKRCLASIAFKSWGDVNGQGKWPEPVVKTSPLAAVLQRFSLASRQATSLFPPTERPVPKAGARFYVCDTDFVENKLAGCHADTDPVPDISTIPDAFARYLQHEATLPFTLGEEDFAPRTVRVAAEAIPAAPPRVFDWSLANMEASKVGIEGFSAMRAAGQFMNPASHPGEDVTVRFACTVLEDYSVFCGSVFAEPEALTTRFNWQLQIIAQNAARQRVKPVMKNGKDAAGQYFMFRIVFRKG